jgi:hypothetical protein
VSPTYLPEDTDDRLSILLEHLRGHRYLLILDNLEVILSSGNFAEHYREGYEAYGKLLRRLGEERHKICLVLIESFVHQFERDLTDLSYCWR